MKEIDMEELKKFNPKLYEYVKEDPNWIEEFWNAIESY